MKNMSICYSEHAVKVSDSYCSGSSDKGFSSSILAASIQTSVTCVYRVKASSDEQFFVRLRWWDRLNNKGFAFGVCKCNHPLSSDRISEDSRILRKSRGTEAFKSCDDSLVEIFWDFSHAKFGSGPEPATRFYLVIILDSEVVLILGDMDQEIIEIKARVPTTMGSTLVSRAESFSGGHAVCSTRARFGEGGAWHDVLIKCLDGDGPALRRNPALYVYMDEKMVIEVKRLRWNFRGNQTIFLDGLLVDMMWDVHDWIFRPCLGCGIFLFRTRIGLDSRLWLDDKSFGQNRDDKGGFSLLISVSKNPD